MLRGQAGAREGVGRGWGGWAHLLPLQRGPALALLHHQVWPRALIPPAIALPAPQLAPRYAQQARRVASLAEHLPRWPCAAVRGPVAHARRQVLARDEGDGVRRRVVQREAQRHVGMRGVELQHRELAPSQRASDREPVRPEHQLLSPR